MQSTPINRINRDAIDAAYAAFRLTKATPGMTIEQVMFEAGAMKAIEWMDQRISQRSSVSTVTVTTTEAIEAPHTTEAFLRRVTKGVSSAG